MLLFAACDGLRAAASRRTGRDGGFRSATYLTKPEQFAPRSAARSVAASSRIASWPWWARSAASAAAVYLYRVSRDDVPNAAKMSQNWCSCARCSRARLAERRRLRLDRTSRPRPRRDPPRITSPGARTSRGIRGRRGRAGPPPRRPAAGRSARGPPGRGSPREAPSPRRRRDAWSPPPTPGSRTPPRSGSRSESPRPCPRGGSGCASTSLWSTPGSAKAVYTRRRPRGRGARRRRPRPDLRSGGARQSRAPTATREPSRRRAERGRSRIHVNRAGRARGIVAAASPVGAHPRVRSGPAWRHFLWIDEALTSKSRGHRSVNVTPSNLAKFPAQRRSSLEHLRAVGRRLSPSFDVGRIRAAPPRNTRAALGAATRLRGVSTRGGAATTRLRGIAPRVGAATPPPAENDLGLPLGRGALGPGPRGACGPGTARPAL